MKNKIFGFGLLIFFIASCSGSESAIKAKETYINLFNTQITGMQEDKLRQGLENYYQGNYSFCIEIYKELIPSFLAQDHQEAVINSLFLLGSSYVKKEKYLKAIETYRLAALRLNLMVEKSKTKQYYVSLYFVEMGEVFLKKRTLVYEEFLQSFLIHGLKETEKSQSQYLQARAYRNLGKFFFTLEGKKEQGKARSYFLAAFFLSKKIQNSVLMAQISTALGRDCAKQKEYTEALEYYMVAYRIYQIRQYYFRQALILAEIGALYEKVREYKRALSFYQRSFEIIMHSERIENDVKQKYYNRLHNKITELKSKIPDYKAIDQVSNLGS